ncbi:NAD-dependent epimerase/dehydratase family protein [Candidatus Microthrix parvicella]|jgi:dihydroflavonol-4-reductase|uniref:NAD-dependent epimerase/dehydratase family protein n=1 Tax=Candidatus Neomicrothrix parvicella TaxID=41950 RepID=UPI00036C566C|nr:NAD-dependent epimerase/dehydratase family protein [Candidatus Microthrix parvicella]
MTRATVTGAYGLVGANLVRALLDQGVVVRAADVRRTDSLDGLDVEHVEADVLDPEALGAAFADADVVFHLAAMISIVGDPTGKVRQVNVQGPRNAGTAARAAGVGRFVHCSSVHAFDLHSCGPSLDETGPRTAGAPAPAYDQSKFAGEQALREAAGTDLDFVIVNPTGVIGIHDHGPSRVGETILELRDNKIPVNVGGGFDFVDVRDLVDGMIAAWRQGRTGENYLLSGTRISIKELAQIVSSFTGSRVPRIDVPLSLITPLGPLVMRLTPGNRIPIFTPDSLHALRYSPSVSHYKAATELGYRVRPIHETVGDTLNWFAAAGS